MPDMPTPPGPDAQDARGGAPANPGGGPVPGRGVPGGVDPGAGVHPGAGAGQANPHSPTAPGDAPADGVSAQPDRVKPAAIAAGAASLALAGGIVAATLTSGAGGGTAGADVATTGTAGPSSGGTTPTGTTGTTGTTDSTDTPTTTSPTTTTDTPTTTGPTTSGAALGTWTGDIHGGGDPVGTRITLDGDPSAVTGTLLFADPETSDWVHAGTLSGTMSGTDLRLQSDTQVVLTLAAAGDTLTGTGTLNTTKQPFPVTVTLRRS